MKVKTPAAQSHKSAWHLGEYRSWDIFVVREGYVQMPDLKVSPLYLAINYFTDQIVTGVDLPDLEADVDEALRSEVRKGINLA